VDNKQTDSKEKITLPKNLQREIIKFFAHESMNKNAKADKDQQQTSPNQNGGGAKE